MKYTGGLSSPPLLFAGRWHADRGVTSDLLQNRKWLIQPDVLHTMAATTRAFHDRGGKLRELGAQTPFEFAEMADAGRKLIAFGESADSVDETLRQIGDVYAGGRAPVNEIAELYGKARVQGRLFAEDINQFTGRGIMIIQELAKQFGVSDSEVKKLVESGKVGFPNIERTFIDMTSQGGRLAGMMEAQSKTTSGLFSTLKDTINEVFLTLGTPINDVIRPLVEQAIGLVHKLTPRLARWAAAGIRLVPSTPSGKTTGSPARRTGSCVT